MKQTFTFILALCLSILSYSQTTWDVNVQFPAFTPSNLVIEVGDIVEWTNSSGSHNVNGTLTTFPNNPEGFGNSVGAGWTFSHTFSIAGSYDYRCDPHFASGMTGTITVIDPLGVEEIVLADFSIYPNPNNGQFTIVNDGVDGEYLLELMDVTGKVVYANQMHMNTNERTEISSSDVTTGIYLVKLTNTKENSYRTIRMVIK